MEMLTAHQVEKARADQQVPPRRAGGNEAIIDKMTAKSPLQRYQTAKEVAEKLRTWLAESGSGRTSYSRISALMAEAARAKQPSPDGTAPAAAKATDRKDFEFATLDDEPSAASSSASSSSVAAKSSSSAVTKAGAAATVEAKDQNRQGSARKMVPPVAKRAATKLAKSPSGRLLPDDLISALPPPETLSPASGSLPHMAARQAQNESTFKTLPRSPWLWVGLGGAVGLALLAVLVVVFTSSPTEHVVEPPEATEPLSPGMDQATQPPSLKSAPPLPPPLASSPSPTVQTPPPQPAGALPGAPAGGPPATPPAAAPPSHRPSSH